MASWDNDPVVGAPTAPALPDQSTPSTGPNPWDRDPIAGPSPRAKAVVSANENPEAAGQALGIAKQTGIPASIVQTDLPGYDAHAKTQSAIQAVQNPAIAKYIDSHPMAAQVSNDDWKYLQQISPDIQNLQPDKIQAKASVGVFAGMKEVGELLTTAPGREKLYGALKQLPGALGQGMLDFLATPGKVASGEIDLSTDEGLNKAIGFGVGVALGGRDIKFGRTAETGAAVSPPGSVDDFLAKVRGLKTREEIDAFIKAKTEGEAGPMLQIEHANAAGAALDKAVEVAQDSKTKVRSPDLFEQFVEAHGDSGTVHVPAQAIVDLYAKEGKVPLAGDGLFGWVPGIADKASLAAETGAEIPIPLAKYVANIDPAVHEGLADQVRVQENGVTREEAKAQVEEQKAKIEAFHGTPHDFESFDLSKIGTGEGAQVYGHGLYFAENKAVSQTYAENLAQIASPHNQAYSYLMSAGEDRAEALSLARSDLNAPHMDKNTSSYKNLSEAVKILESGKDIDVPRENGNLYKVHINADPTHFLDWDRPFNEQSEHVQNALTKAAETNDDLAQAVSAGYSGQEIRELLTRRRGMTDEAASKMLAEAGIPGIKYLDQQSRDATPKLTTTPAGDVISSHYPPKTSNFVVFDDKLVKIIEKNDNPIVQAVEAATAAAQASLGLRPIENFLTPFLKDGETVGITKSEFDRYAKLIDRQQEEILNRAVAFAAKEKARRLGPEWKENEARVGKAVDGLMFNRPDFAADRFFNQGQDLAGKPLPKELRVKMGEVPADEYAPMFGFESGSEMTAAVLRLEQERADTGLGPKAQFAAHVKAETAKQMEATYGHLADNIAIEASEAALADYNVDVLATEIKLLAKLNGREPPVGREELTAWTKDQFERGTASEVSYETWRRAAEKTGREVEKALLKKDFAEAIVQKQKQMQNLMLAKEAKKFEKVVDGLNRDISRIQDNAVLSNVEQEYTDQLHRLIDQMGFKTPRAPGELNNALEGRPFNAFISEKEGAGQEMPVSPILQTGRAIDFDGLSVADYRAVADSISTILHNGREAKTIRVGNEKRDRAQTVAEALNQVADVDPKVIEREPGLLADLRKNLTAFDSMMLKMEQLLRWMDKRDKFGVFSQAGFRPLVEAKHVKNDLLKEMGKDIKAIPGSDAWREGLNTEIPNTNLSILDWQTGEPMKLRRKDIVMMILHSGNESNLAKLTSKYNYNNKDYQWEASDIEKLIKDHATKEDWDHAQGWWDTFEKYWPQVEKLSRNMSGLAPDKIEGRTITNDFGTYKGGYVPVGADLLWPGLKKVEQGVFNSDRYFNAIPPKGYTKSRTEVGYPVSLAFDNLTNTMYQMAHDLAFREPLTNAAKFLDNADVRGAIQRVLGPEYLKQVRPWLEFQASAKRVSDESVSAMDSMARMARQRIVAVQLLYRVSTIIKHGAAAALYSVGEVGLKDMVHETMRLWGTADGRARVGEILNESGELRHRLHDMDRDLGEIQDQNLGKSGAKAAFYHWGGMGTSALDLGTAIPTYEVAKKNALVEGKSEADAIYAGEAAVRDAHGSSGITDQAPILRAGEVYKLFTIAYGTFNHNYNRLRDAGRLFKEAGEDFAAGDRMDAWDKFQTAAYRSLWYVFLVAMAEEAIQPIPDKQGEKHGVIAWTAQALFHQLAGTIPVAREAARSYLYGRNDSGQTPMGQIMQSVGTGGKSLWEHDFEKKNRVKQAVEGTGYLLKVPGAGQLSQTLQYLTDLKTGRQSGENPYRLGRGVAMGKSHPERK